MTDLNHETEEGVALESTPKGTRWSPSQRGFFDYGYPGDLPGDLLDVTAEEHAALMAGQAQGKRIVAGASGVPVLQDPPAPTLAEQQAAAIRRIDADADAIYGAVLGNRGEEYKAAEADARAFQAAGYADDVPAGVASWVAASGMSAQGAADDILATAEAWRGAMAQIRANRLARKKAVEAAADQAGIDAAMAAWAGFVAATREALGV
jgi:hypothetical protein